MWVVKFSPIFSFGDKDRREFETEEKAKQWAQMCGYSKTCKIEEKEKTE